MESKTKGKEVTLDVAELKNKADGFTNRVFVHDGFKDGQYVRVEPDSTKFSVAQVFRVKLTPDSVEPGHVAMSTLQRQSLNPQWKLTIGETEIDLYPPARCVKLVPIDVLPCGADVVHVIVKPFTPLKIDIFKDELEEELIKCLQGEVVVGDNHLAVKYQGRGMSVKIVGIYSNDDIKPMKEGLLTKDTRFRIDGEHTYSSIVCLHESRDEKARMDALAAREMAQATKAKAEMIQGASNDFTAGNKPAGPFGSTDASKQPGMD